MAPTPQLGKRVPSSATEAPTRASLTLEGGFLEAWAEGYNVGSLVILILIVFCNYRSGIWLHKLILLELVLALWHGTFIFAQDPVYGWYLSATATLLFVSYQIHNVVAWLKIRPFLPKWGSRVFILTLLAVQPFWIAEAWSNFEYFNGLGNTTNTKMRAWEALFRDPWWIFTTWKLINAIKKTYAFKLWALVKISPRFGVMIACMILSIVFLVTDVVVTAAHVTRDSGINPYWRFALVFKCASDTIFLDDFKFVLDEIVAKSFSQTGGTKQSGAAMRPRRRSTRSPGPPPTQLDFVECGPITNVSSPAPAQKLETIQKGEHARKFNPFVHHPNTKSTKRNSKPRIHVSHETSVTSESRRNRSRDSADSEQNMLSIPPRAMSFPREDVGSSRSPSLSLTKNSSVPER